MSDVTDTINLIAARIAARYPFDYNAIWHIVIRHWPRGEADICAALDAAMRVHGRSVNTLILAKNILEGYVLPLSPDPLTHP